MKPIGRRLAEMAFLALAIARMATRGQTMLDLRAQARNMDFSGAAWTRPVPVGTTLPPTCAGGQMFFKADAAPGRNLFLCTATNMWTGVDSSSSQPTLPAQTNSAGQIL